MRRHKKTKSPARWPGHFDERLDTVCSHGADAMVRVRKKAPVKRENSKLELPPGAVTYGKATSTMIGTTPAVQVHGLGGPMTSLIAKKGHKEMGTDSVSKVIPRATGYRARRRLRNVTSDSEFPLMAYQFS